ncbi:MAG TPA: sigma-70 family RNA polymerase sigma factor [Pyrinomonadaceae bacterium]|nr:sigma-70 family RNA polymerase sigma factor [Pyrinomonadaceae bacterium]
MAANVEQLTREGAARVLERGGGAARSLDTEALLPRVRASVNKYLLRDRPDASAEVVREFIDALRAEELVLVVACERGDEAAWRELMEGYRATVMSAARAASAGESEAEELAQSVWAELYGLRTRADGAPAGKLAYYSGCGSLGGWLRAVVGQLGVDRHRRTSRLVQTEEATDFDRLVGDDAATTARADGFMPRAAPDPERALAQREATESVQAALARAVAGLDAEDRLLVKLYYLDGLRLKEAGAVLGVHEATASRRLTRIHTEIRRRVEEILVEERGWTREETATRLAEVAARLDTDLSSLLTAEASAGDKRGEVFE